MFFLGGIKAREPRGHCRENGLVWEPGCLGAWLSFAINELGDLSQLPIPPDLSFLVHQMDTVIISPVHPTSLRAVVGRIKGENKSGRSEPPL